MKKRISAILLALVFIVGFVAACSNAPVICECVCCSNEAPTPEVESPAAETEIPEVEAPIEQSREASDVARGVFITQDMSGASQPFSWYEFQRLMGDYNLELTVNAGDAVDNVASIEKAIADNLDVIIINPNDIEVIIPALTRAREAGIIVGLYWAQPPSDNYPFDFFVGSDDYLGAKQAGEFVSKLFPEGANFVEVGGQAGHTAATSRYLGFRTGIASNIIELDSLFVPGPWQADEARGAMEYFLSTFGDEINIVWCHWDNGASGVIEAVHSSGRIAGTDIAAGEIFIIGFDGSSIGYQQVMDGVQTLSVGQSFTNMIIKSLELARIMLDGGTVEKMNWIPYDMVTLDTIHTFPWPEW